MQEGEFFFILLFQESSYLFSSKESIGQELGNSFAPNIRIKEEPLDDEYAKAMAPQQGLLDKIKDEPDNSEVSFPLHFSLWSDSWPHKMDINPAVSLVWGPKFDVKIVV